MIFQFGTDSSHSIAQSATQLEVDTTVSVSIICRVGGNREIVKRQPMQTERKPIERRDAVSLALQDRLRSE